MPLSITSELLIKLAGKPAYERGKTVYNNKQIESWKQSGKTITARVDGTHSYRVILKLSERMLDGGCSCPASENFDFCKHCVAVALAYANQQENIDQIASSGDDERLAAYLESRPKAELVKALAGFIDNDTFLKKRWLIKADSSLGLMDSKAIRKKITQSLPYRSIWKYHQVAAYFANAESLLELLTEPLATLAAEDRLKLVEYAYVRLNKALEKIDDSNGYRFEIESQLHTALTQAFHALAWSDKRKAQFLSKQLTVAADIYPEIPGDFIRNKDTTLNALFIEQCENQWLELIKNGVSDEWDYPLYTLTRILLEQAKEDKNTQREIDILIATATRSNDYVKLAEKFIELKRYDEAEPWLDKAKRSERYDQSEQLLPLRIKIDIGRKHFQAALDKQWQLYASSPSQSHYLKLIDLYAKNQLPAAEGYQRVEQHLQALSKIKPKPMYDQLANRHLIEFYLNQNEADKAAAIAKQTPVDAYQLSRIALAIAKSKPQQSTEFYLRVITRIAGKANNNAYAEAVNLLAKLEAELKEESREAFDQMIHHIKETKELKRKINFIKLLNTRFPR